jgi:hypothetical protein
MRQRQAKYRSRCSVRSPCATRKPRRGRPFASLLRRGGETSGVGRRDRRTLCASVARPVWAAHPQFSCSARIACSAKAALRRLGTRSELARQALKSSVAKHGQFLEGPSLRQKRQNSQSIDKRHSKKERSVAHQHRSSKPAQPWHGRSCSRRCLSTSAKKSTQRAMEMATKRSGRVADDGAPTSDDESAR